MSMVYWAIIGLGAFVAIWILFVIPAERRHHERKLEIIQRRIEKRQGQDGNDSGEGSDETSTNEERS